MKATEVTAGLAESNGSLLPGLWRDSLHQFLVLVTYGRGLVLLWRPRWRRSDTLCTSGFMDDVIFALHIS